MNKNWENYNKLSDRYIVDKFESLKKFGRFVHNSCIFLFVWDIIQNIINIIIEKVERKHFDTIDNLRVNLNEMVDNQLSKIIDDLIIDDFNCENECVSIPFEEGKDLIK
jgi:hypothetical protein